MRVLLLLLLIRGAPPATDAPLSYALSSGTLTYTLSHKFHEMTGTSKVPQARARLRSDGTLQVMVRAPVSSFDSGNANRDVHMLEAVEGARFPNVELKGVASGVNVPSRFPATLNVLLKGDLTFHGVTRAIDLPIALTFPDASNVEVETAFDLSLEAFHIERPSLLYVKVDDKLGIGAKLTMRRE